MAKVSTGKGAGVGCSLVWIAMFLFGVWGQEGNEGAAWPNWRGPHGSGSVDEPGIELVDELGQARLVWKSEVKVPNSYGRMTDSKDKINGGFCDPVIAAGRVYLYYTQPSGPLAENYLQKEPYGKYHENLGMEVVRPCAMIRADDVFLSSPQSMARGRRQGLLYPGQRPSKTYRTYRWGKGLQIWLLEGRDFRSPNKAPDGPGKSIWGEEQKRWLFETLRASDADWKIIVSPTPLRKESETYRRGVRGGRWVIRGRGKTC